MDTRNSAGPGYVNHDTRSSTRSAHFSRGVVVIGSGVVLGRILGYVREMLLARAFGVSSQMDALVVSLNIADILAGILLGGATAAVIMPPLAQLHNEGNEERFWWISINLVSLAALPLAFISLLAISLAPLIVGIIAPGLPTEAFEAAVGLTRITCASIFFSGIAVVFSSVLQARRQFLVPSSTAALHNAVLIVFILFLVPYSGVLMVGWGVVAGAAVRFLATYWTARREGMEWHWLARWRDPESLHILYKLLPAVLGFLVVDINILIDRNFASHLAQGSIAALNFAEKLVRLPLALIGGALSIAILPSFSVQAKKHRWKQMRHDLLIAMGLVGLTAVPVSLLLVLLRVPIIDLAFRRGAFDDVAVQMTAPALYWFACGLPFISANLVLTRVFHARSDLNTPLWIGLIVVLVHIALNVFCVERWGYVGIAISNAMTYSIHTTCLLIALRIRTPLRILT